MDKYELEERIVKKLDSIRGKLSVAEGLMIDYQEDFYEGGYDGEQGQIERELVDTAWDAISDLMDIYKGHLAD